MKMKKRLFRLTAILIITLMLTSSALAAGSVRADFPEAPAEAAALKTPDGYNEHDYAAVCAFLEQTDPDGITNGTKLSADYDPLDPSTWGMNAQGEPRFRWTGEGELRLEEVSCNAVRGMLYGTLDLNGCTSLKTADIAFSALTTANFGACAALESLVINNNRISHISVDMCSSLRLLNTAGNALTELDVSCCPALRFLECRWNQIRDLDLANCPELTVLICTDNCLKELDLSNNPLLGCVRLLRIVDAGQQYVSCYLAEDPEYTGTPTYFISADCYESCGEFGSWYTMDGRLITSERAYTPVPEDGGVFIARYNESGTAPGDANNDGEVDVSDALLIMRAAMDLIPQQPRSAMDVDGDGEVSAVDAILIMRRAMDLY